MIAPAYARDMGWNPGGKCAPEQGKRLDGPQLQDEYGAKSLTFEGYL
jgi:hypothetical protein